MILISHRGNINGRNPVSENTTAYIDTAIDSGYDVEVDIWKVKGGFMLGHDKPTHPISTTWLLNRSNRLWLHCKDIETIEWFSYNTWFHYFWHQNDTVTLTSKGYLWAYVGKQPIEKSIAVLPELNNDDVSKCIGVCSDVIINYQLDEKNISNRR